MNDTNISGIKHILQTLPNDIENRKEKLIFLFKENKYKNIKESIAVLIFLEKIFLNKEELYWHLFNHYIIFGLYDEALRALRIIINENEFIINICKEYKPELPENVILDINRNGLDSLKEWITKSLDKNKYFSAYYEIAVYLKDILPDRSIEFLKKAYKLSDGKMEIRILLSMVKTYIENNNKEKAIKLLKDKIYNSDENDSAILYRLASLIENEEPDKALNLFKQIKKNGNDYLDTEERISNLTKSLKKFIIKDQDDDINNDNGTIQFS